MALKGAVCGASHQAGAGFRVSAPVELNPSKVMKKLPTAEAFITLKNKQFEDELKAAKDMSRFVSMKDIGREGKLNFVREKWAFVPASNLPQRKVFVVEKLRKVKPTGKLAYKKSWRDGEIEYRVGYYIVGRIGRAKNKWIWGQFCPIIPAADWWRITEQIVEMADDELYEEAKKIVIAAQTCSVSMLQRKLMLGYARATRLVDMLEEKGIVSSANGAEPRKVLIPKNKSSESNKGK